MLPRLDWYLRVPSELTRSQRHSKTTSKMKYPSSIVVYLVLGLLAGSCPVQVIAQDSSQDAHIEQDAKVAQDPSDTPLPAEAETDGLILPGPLPPVLGLGLGLAAGVAVEALRPRPAFSCVNRYPGYYADQFNNCKNFYICTPDGGRHYFECGFGTIFNQVELICDHRHNYDCRRAPNDFGINELRRPFLFPLGA